jgi:peptidoglycan hydrolase CwlO-like protein
MTNTYNPQKYDKKIAKIDKQIEDVMNSEPLTEDEVDQALLKIKKLKKLVQNTIAELEVEHFLLYGAKGQEPNR